MRLRNPTPLLLALAACVAVGCGADEETKPSIPGTASDALLQQLGSVQGRFDFGDGACNDIVENVRAVNAEISRLPSSVDSDVRDALQESFDHLFDLTDEQCDADKGDQTDTNSDTTATTETQTPETETDTTDTSTDTTDTGTTETTPPDTDTDDLPPGQGGEPPGQGGDNPGGGAQGPGL